MANVPPSRSTLQSILEAFGRFVAFVATATLERGPEFLASMARIQVGVEYFALLEAEWANHPLLDFIRWQEMRAGETMAMTLPQGYLAGHRTLAELLRPVFADGVIVDRLASRVAEPEFAGWAADEFRHGLEHFRAGGLERAVGPLTLGLEGLLRISAVSQCRLTRPEVDELRSGSRLVKRLWGEGDPYRPYMDKWVFGLANVYRHGGDRDTSQAQALHALCGAAIWAGHLLHEADLLEEVQTRLSREVERQYLDGRLQMQPDAEGRIERAADRAGRSESVQRLLELREQLIEIREAQRLPAVPYDPRALRRPSGDFSSR